MDQSKVDRKAIRHPVCAFRFVHPQNTLNTMENWTERAKTRMRELGITQEALAEKFDMTPAGMQKWLAGARQPALDDINRIADTLGVARTWLTHGIMADSTIDGLSGPAQEVLRHLITIERHNPLPSTFWQAVESMANAVTPIPKTERSEDPIRDGTRG